MLDRRVRDLRHADGGVALARHRPDARGPRPHARRAGPGDAPTCSTATTSTTTCATSPTTTTPTPGPQGGFFGHGQRKDRSALGLLESTVAVGSGEGPGGRSPTGGGSLTSMPSLAGRDRSRRVVAERVLAVVAGADASMRSGLCWRHIELRHRSAKSAPRPTAPSRSPRTSGAPAPRRHAHVRGSMWWRPSGRIDLDLAPRSSRSRGSCTTPSAGEPFFDDLVSASTAGGRRPAARPLYPDDLTDSQRHLACSSSSTGAARHLQRGARATRGCGAPRAVRDRRGRARRVAAPHARGPRRRRWSRAGDAAGARAAHPRLPRRRRPTSSSTPAEPTASDHRDREQHRVKRPIARSGVRPGSPPRP